MKRLNNRRHTAGIDAQQSPLGLSRVHPARPVLLQEWIDGKE
jgi:hypothetical protein